MSGLHLAPFSMTFDSLEDSMMSGSLMVYRASSSVGGRLREPTSRFEKSTNMALNATTRGW